MTSKVILRSLLSLVILLFSCGKDDDNDNSKSDRDNIVGSYLVNYTLDYSCSQGNGNPPDDFSESKTFNMIIAAIPGSEDSVTITSTSFLGPFRSLVSGNGITGIAILNSIESCQFTGTISSNSISFNQEDGCDTSFFNETNCPSNSSLFSIDANNFVATKL